MEGWRKRRRNNVKGDGRRGVNGEEGGVAEGKEEKMRFSTRRGMSRKIYDSTKQAVTAICPGFFGHKRSKQTNTYIADGDTADKKLTPHTLSPLQCCCPGIQ